MAGARPPRVPADTRALSNTSRPSAARCCALPSEGGALAAPRDRPAEHEGHEVLFYCSSGGGGCCDGGDAEAWNEHAPRALRGLQKTKRATERELPLDFATTTSMVFGECLDFVLALVRDTVCCFRGEGFGPDGDPDSESGAAAGADGHSTPRHAAYSVWLHSDERQRGRERGEAHPRSLSAAVIPPSSRPWSTSTRARPRRPSTTTTTPRPHSFKR